MKKNYKIEQIMSLLSFTGFSINSDKSVDLHFLIEKNNYNPELMNRLISSILFHIIKTEILRDYLIGLNTLEIGMSGEFRQYEAEPNNTFLLDRVTLPEILIDSLSLKHLDLSLIDKDSSIGDRFENFEDFILSNNPNLWKELELFEIMNDCIEDTELLDTLKLIIKLTPLFKVNNDKRFDLRYHNNKLLKLISNEITGDGLTEDELLKASFNVNKQYLDRSDILETLKELYFTCIFTLYKYEPIKEFINLGDYLEINIDINFNVIVNNKVIKAEDILLPSLIVRSGFFNFSHREYVDIREFLVNHDISSIEDSLEVIALSKSANSNYEATTLNVKILKVGASISDLE